MKNNSYNSKFKPKTKKTTAWYISLVIIIMTILGSILGSIAFFKSCSYDESNTLHTNVAYADENQQYFVYRGSNIWVPCTPYTHVGGFREDVLPSRLNSVSINPTITYRDNVYFIGNNLYLDAVPYMTYDAVFSITPQSPYQASSFLFPINLTSGTDYEKIYTNTLANFNTRYVGGRVMNNDDFVTSINQVRDTSKIICDYVVLPENYSFSVEGEINAWITTTTTMNFNSNVKYFRLWTETKYFNPNTPSTFIFMNHITYYDEFSNTFDIAFHGIFPGDTYNGMIAPSSFGFKDRFYFLEESGVSSDILINIGELQDTINDLRTEVDDLEGELRVKQDIIDNWSDLKDQAIEEAYQNGKLDGATNANEYSFLGLIGAIFDAPIKVLGTGVGNGGLLNFEILGFNLWSLLTALITIGLIIFIVRLFL